MRVKAGNVQTEDLLELEISGASVTTLGGRAVVTIPGLGSGGTVDVFNVKDAAYGALGDGVTDDTNAITAAINACNAAPNGGIILFPAGQYVTTGNHPALQQKARIEGRGVTSTNILHTGNNRLFLFTAPGVTNERIGISNLLITGNSGAAAIGLEFRDLNFGGYATHVRIINYSGTDGIGILIHNFASLQFTEGVQLDDVSISNCLTAISFYRTSGTISFNATHFKNVAINVPNNGTAISVCARAGSAAGTIYNATFTNVQIWFDVHTNNFGIDIGASSQVQDTFMWVHGEGLSGSSKVLRVQAGSTLVYWGSLQFGKDATSTLTGLFFQVLWAPSSVGNSNGNVGIAVAPQGAASGTVVLGVSPYNGTVPSLPSTTAGQLCGFDKDGAIIALSYQGNVRIRSVSNVLEYRDPNSLLYPLSEKTIAIAEAAGGGATIDASLGTVFQITVADATAFTIANPTNSATGRRITLIIFNNSGGAMGVITFGANYALAGAFTNPATAKRRTVDLVFDSVAGKWFEVCRAAADI